MHCMPCWTLPELLFAGKYLHNQHSDETTVDFSQEAITEMFERFGGIFWCALPHNTEVVNAKQSQHSAISNTKLVDIFMPHANIEKTDSNKDNISYLILNYRV